MTRNEENATKLNDCLKAGGVVRVSTQLRATDYTTKHAGWFYADAQGNLRVKSGRGSVVLAYPSMLLVDVRLFTVTK